MMGGLLLLACLAFLAAGLHQKLNIVTYKVKTAKVAASRPIRLLLLSDLHGQRHGDGQCRLIAHAKRLRPDAVMLAGDMVEPGGGTDAAMELVQGLVPIAPVFYVTGNHDLMTFDCDAIKRQLTLLGAQVLQDETVALSVRGEALSVSGVDEPFSAYIRGVKDKKGDYKRRVAALAPLDEKKFNLLLAHRPEYIEDYELAGFDLALCGHAHGGQIRLPFVLNGLFVTGQGFFPKYAGGIYRHGGLWEVVGRGLHVSPFRPRFFNRPELVVIEITGEA